MALLDEYVAMVLAESGRQNLIAASTVDGIWQRHVLDSLQLLELASVDGRWADIGSGAGFPGMVVALATTREVHLIEPRARRAAFLANVVRELQIGGRVHVHARKVQQVPLEFCSIISARAVAPLTDMFDMAFHLADHNSVWLMPKGRRAQQEVAIAADIWQGRIETVPSRTDAEAMIVVATGVRRKDRP